MIRPDSFWLWDDSESVYVNKSDDIKTGTAITFLEDTDDVAYIGFSRRFSGLRIEVSTAGSYEGLSFEYWDGENWVKASLEESYDFSANGRLTFILPEDSYALNFSDTSPHAAEPPDEVERHWLKITATTVTTAAVISKLRVLPYVLYTNPKLVQEFLGIKDEFDRTTYPSFNSVENLIKRAEGVIDRKTLRSWRLNREEDEEHAFNINGIKLFHYPIEEVTSVEVWTGGTWKGITEGRTDDYFYNKSLGMLYFSRYFLFPARYAYSTPTRFRFGFGEFMFPLRVTYLWGEGTAVSDFYAVQEIANKLVAIELARTSDYSIIFPSGTDKVELAEKSRVWKEEVEESMENLRRLLVF